MKLTERAQPRYVYRGVHEAQRAVAYPCLSAVCTGVPPEGTPPLTGSCFSKTLQMSGDSGNVDMSTKY